MNKDLLAEEDKKMRWLRFLVDLAQATIDGLEVDYARRLGNLEGQGACEPRMDRYPATCCCVVIE